MERLPTARCHMAAQLVTASAMSPRRGASGKIIIFGIFKRNGCVYTEIVPDCEKATLQAIIRGRVAPKTISMADGWHGYDGLVDVTYSKNLRVAHDANECARVTRLSMASRDSGVSPNIACRSSTASTHTNHLFTPEGVCMEIP